MSKQSVLITCLLRLVVNELIGKAIFDLLTSVLLMVGCRLFSDVLMELVKTMPVDFATIMHIMFNLMALKMFTKIIHIDTVLVQHSGIDFVVVLVRMVVRVYCEFVVPLSVMVLIHKVLLDNVESHFEDIVSFIRITETFFLMFCVNIAQLLGSL